MFDEPINVPCVKLSDWAKENNFNAIDFIWVDAQGAELSVLRGAGDLLESVHAILMEVWQKSYYEGSGCYREIKEFLESRGFRQTHVWMEGDSGDVLFANNKFRCGL